MQTIKQNQKRSGAFKITAMAFMAATALALNGCALDTPSQMERSALQVVKEDHRTSYNTETIDKALLETVRDHYLQSGEGPVHVTVTYDPRVRGNSAMTASNEAGKIAALMARMGARNVKTEILPVKDSGSVSKTIFSYDVYTASAPEDCELMQGIEGRETKIDHEYTFGCSHDIFLARQIARPQDLLGNTASGKAGGRRHANWIVSYDDGEPNGPLEGLSTTD